ncbi:hypothetical protein Taro_012749 [Colocasia esculenta]|uniref:Uncharacterized protein n=1 Tax=Colocasia esculenta TaxID=4460 RepID=A0A843UA19_COLES|nr:hypothetical protein [Colocasia esculenta]
MSYENRSWMYRGIVNGVVTEEFKDGVDSFIRFALRNSSIAVDPMEVESHHPVAEEVAQPAGCQPCWISRYIFTRPEDLPRARVVWESTAQTNFRKSMWEARDKAERSQAAKRNRAAHLEKNVHTSGSVSYATHGQKLRHKLERAPTFRELFDRTHKRKGADDYETYDRTMTDLYVEGTPQPNLDPEAWVDAAGGPRKGRVYGFGDSLDTTLVLSSYACLVAPPAYTSSSAVTPGSGGEYIRTLIQKELLLHLGAMVEQLVDTIQGAGPTWQAPQDQITQPRGPKSEIGIRLTCRSL